MPDNEVPKHPTLVVVGGKVPLPTGDPVTEFAETLDRCTAKASSGSTCSQPVAVRGATVCRLHGGAAPQVQAAALERLRETRDAALERLLSSIKERGDRLDPRVLLDITTKLTDKVELLEGRATARTETSEFNLTEIRATFNAKLDDLASSYSRAPMVLDMIDQMMGEGEYAEEAVKAKAIDV